MVSPPILVSACLTGLCTRYDSGCRADAACLDALRGLAWIPCCPEQLGGLPTPRMPADIHGGDGDDVLVGIACIIAKNGADVTPAFLRGAEECAKIVAMFGIRQAFLKARSPSCAVTGVIGVTAALLRRQGVMLSEF